MTGRQDDAGRTLRSLLLEETSAMPVDTHNAALGLRRRIAHTRKRRQVTLAVAASVAAALVATAVGGWLGVDKADDPALNPEQPEAVARGFLDAYGSFDADRALTYLTTDAIAQGVAEEDRTTPEQLRLGIASERALGYKQTIRGCEHQGNSASGVSLRCAFDFHAIRSDEIGLGPYTGNYWSLTVRDGKIVSARREVDFTTSGFEDQIWEPFAKWVSIEHPDDALALGTDESQGIQPVTADSIRLSEQRTAEYVAAVTQNPAAHLDQPKVAAYVAQLDSICAAAQAKVKNEIQAIPQQNQPAAIQARERIMRETIPKLRAAPPPAAVFWPYEGRAFPLMEKLFNEYPHNRQQLEASLPHQIQQTPGLDKCIFTV
jgi:hypothetical protein